MLKTNSLQPEIQQIICAKATEYPGSGEYNDLDQAGTYLCRQCGLALFRAQHKFHSGCGWPSFEQEIKGNVKQQLDTDGHRTEILCARCDGHLGHVFQGEHFTQLNIRHCVNSKALDFVPSYDVQDTEEAIVAAGCFWGVEYYFQKLPGVLKVEVGYSGGDTNFPTYKEVCNTNTGHLEAVRIVFDTALLTYKEVIKYFFEIHDPTQTNGQGPDIGPQYLSAIFYYNDEQFKIAKELQQALHQLGCAIATQMRPITIFWPAEAYHQNYYVKHNQEPYCHIWQNRFNDKVKK